jgi:hypothetical protein
LCNFEADPDEAEHDTAKRDNPEAESEGFLRGDVRKSFSYCTTKDDEGRTNAGFRLSSVPGVGIWPTPLRKVRCGGRAESGSLKPGERNGGDLMSSTEGVVIVL